MPLRTSDAYWRGTLDDIAETIRRGIRSGDAKVRQGAAAMPAFGRDGILKRPDIEHVAGFVPSLVGLRLGPKIDLAAGKQILPTIPGEPRNLT